MAELNDEDAAVLCAISISESLAAASVTAAPAVPYGIALSQRDAVVGIWSYHQHRYHYRSLANWEPLASVVNLEMAMLLTTWMADRDAWTGAPALKGRPH